ncbi:MULTISPECIES: tRNA glutamyl-Q(34) synthetase GluQRS [unclassified Rhizobium]|uniref:tRNA glutamyl-Q(34) synthetase GluQRS n=1 Tax=unclassified Rhizobium TaxID=2613769 RepID=UPI001AE3D11B|nr:MULTISPECIES: tRNA glutamyl-Q(34) synthetase GluQRS [unclassified Rhizobium]MBP2462491.1 glutamyl-Q tRNA(Asp) synthetase [Rhizobium sp. PvP014]MBP2529885.1 glutamyl-Q tRNA(Asp) synthetase [Rhizobium sp. PvP099]
MPAAQIATDPDRPILRFAPSPNGLLHLGHALSAVLNHEMARDMNGRFLLRIEDIDLARSTPNYEDAIYRDLHWLGLSWEEPPRRQSEHFETYREALAELMEMGLVYPAFMTRGEVKARVADFEADGATWPRDPDGSALYPDHDRYLSETKRKTLIESGIRHSWRLDMDKALARVSDALTWREISDGAEKLVPADPAAWGDVVLSRSDAPSSYHLSVTVDDAAQGITHVVRGMDLYHATSVHRLLQELLGLPQPIYHHHRLILGTDGRKLSKSEGSTGLAALRDAGLSPLNIRGLLGLKG